MIPAPSKTGKKGASRGSTPTYKNVLPPLEQLKEIFRSAKLPISRSGPALWIAKDTLDRYFGKECSDYLRSFYEGGSGEGPDLQEQDLCEIFLPRQFHTSEGEGFQVGGIKPQHEVGEVEDSKRRSLCATFLGVGLLYEEFTVEEKSVLEDSFLALLVAREVEDAEMDSRDAKIREVAGSFFEAQKQHYVVHNGKSCAEAEGMNNDEPALREEVDKPAKIKGGQSRTFHLDRIRSATQRLLTLAYDPDTQQPRDDVIGRAHLKGKTQSKTLAYETMPCYSAAEVATPRGIPWHLVRGGKLCPGGSGGVFLFNVDSRLVCAKPQKTNAVAERFASLLWETIRILSVWEQSGEYYDYLKAMVCSKKGAFWWIRGMLEETYSKVEEAQKLLANLAMYPTPYIGVLECVAGLRTMQGADGLRTVGRGNLKKDNFVYNEQQELQGPNADQKRFLEDLGQLTAFDAWTNNLDRIPCRVVWSNEGNFENVMIERGTDALVGIDSAVGLVTDDAGKKAYREKLKRLCQIAAGLQGEDQHVVVGCRDGRGEDTSWVPALCEAIFLATGVQYSPRDVEERFIPGLASGFRDIRKAFFVQVDLELVEPADPASIRKQEKLDRVAERVRKEFASTAYLDGSQPVAIGQQSIPEYVSFVKGNLEVIAERHYNELSVHTFLLERYGLDSGVTTTGQHHAIFNRDVVGLNASSESVLYWSLLLYLGTVVVLCILYFSSNQTADDVDFLPRDGFSDELQDCCTHPNICIASFCCPFARWADTVSQAQLLQFNVALSLWILAGLIDLAWLFPAGVCLVIVVGAYNRMELRATFKLPKSRLTDVLAWVLCMPCAIAQEARHAERARSIQEAVEVGPRAYFQGTVARKPSDSPKRQ
eukprot:g16533.t1